MVCRVEGVGCRFKVEGAGCRFMVESLLEREDRGGRAEEGEERAPPPNFP